jgi:hypothetical protein
MSLFDAREHAGDDEFPPFCFTGMDGSDYELPHPMTLTAGTARKLNQANAGGDEETVFELLGTIAPNAIDALMDLRVGTLAKLMDAWYSAVSDSGKSPSPRSVPNRAARRSKPTSRSGDKTSGRSRSAKSPTGSKS